MKASLCIGSALVLLALLVVFQYVVTPRLEGFTNHSSTLDEDRLEFCKNCCLSGPATCDPAYQCGSCLAGVPLPPFV
jgi:hypothetical protein